MDAQPDDGMRASETAELQTQEKQVMQETQLTQLTQQSHQAQQTREQDWRLHYAMESAGLTYVSVDLVTGQAHTADNFAAVMGYPSLSKNPHAVDAGVQLLLEHVVPADQGLVQAALVSYTSGHPVGCVEYRVLGDDGAIRWIESRWSMKCGEDGQPLSSFATSIDITQRKVAVLSLRASNALCQLALDSAELGTFHLDTTTGTLTADERLHAMFGALPGQLDYEQAFAIIHSEDRDAMRAAVAASTRPIDPAAFAIEYRVVHPSGEVRWMFGKGKANAVDQTGMGKLPSLDGTVADITQRKLADMALREIEAFNRSVIDSSPDCIKVLDLEGRLLSMHNGRTLLGIEDIRPFLHRSWIEFWRGDDVAAASKAVAAGALGHSDRFVGFFRTMRGEARWWDVSVSPILNAAGKPVRLLAVSRDVTARKRAQANLELLASVNDDLARATDVGEMMRSVGAKLAAHLELSLCSFVVIDEAADQVVVAHEWHRADVPSIQGVHRLADFVNADFVRLARSGEPVVMCDTTADPMADAQKFAALKVGALLCVPLLDHGRWRFALCLNHSEPYQWRDDEIELARELTTRIWTQLERRRAEAELRESEQRYRALFESIDEGFCITEQVSDADGKPSMPVDFRYIQANPAFEIQSGLRGVVGKTMRQVLDGRTDAWFAPYESVLRTGVAIRIERELEPTQRTLELYLFRLEPESLGRVAVIFRNVTGRNLLLRKSLEQAESLAALARRKDEFLAMLSHELRNPLAPISHALKLLSLPDANESVQLQARTVIERQVGQLTHLVDDLLDVSRINSGRVQLRPERLVISAVVDRAVQSVQPLIAAHRHELTVSLPEDAVWLYADAARLEQVVVNLLTNAAKYTDDGGKLALRVRVEDDVVVLRLRDSGIGIPVDLLPQIFDLFTQADRSLDRSQSGLGIGLCLVKRLVELHGGTVTAESEVGKGSEFIVRLPSLPMSAEPAKSLLPSAANAAVTADVKTCRVLIVDDNTDAADVLMALLEFSGHDVRAAFDGPTGLQAALDDPPDVMLLDIGLPGLTGIEVAERIRRVPAMQRTVLVAMTGYGQESDRARSLAAGFDHHLTKPADFAQLEKILMEAARRLTESVES